MGFFIDFYYIFACPPTFSIDALAPTEYASAMTVTAVERVPDPRIFRSFHFSRIMRRS